MVNPNDIESIIPVINPEDLQNEIKRIIQDMKKQNPNITKEELVEHERVLNDVVFNLKSPVEAMGFSPQFIEALYAIGYQAFKGGDYDSAFPLFKLLSYLDPSKPRYMAGLASIYYAKKDWEKAQYFFIATSFIDEKDPMPYFYAAECAVEKKDLVEALFFYRGVISRAENSPAYAPLVNRVKMTIESIEKIIPMEPRSANVPSEQFGP